MRLFALFLACSGRHDSGDETDTEPSDASTPDTDVPVDTDDTDLPAPSVEAGSPTSLGTTAFSANGRVHPHGAPASYRFEYGPTEAYGSSTAPRALGPTLSAYYTESWDSGLAGWRGGSG